MSVFNNIKVELSIFLIIIFVIFLPYNFDLILHKYFEITDYGSGGIYLKKFFVNITELGNSGWYFGISFFCVLILFIYKNFWATSTKRVTKLNNFFVSSFIYLLTIGVATQIFKHLIGRSRPNYTDFNEGSTFDFLTFESNYHSFPSGHSSTIFMVCLILCAVLPKLKYLFIIVASVVAFSRVVVGAHFFLDIFAGALLSLIFFKILNNFIGSKYKKLSFSEYVFKKNTHIYHTIVFFIIISLLITIGPSFDLYFSNLFYHGDSQFSLQSFDLLSQIFRKGLLPLILIYILILPFFNYFFKIKKIYFDHEFTFKEIVLLWISQLLTVLLFVNLILKNFWGRARPGDVEELGGKDVFTPWYVYSDACYTNCSFVSGDASVGFSVMILYLITKNIIFFYLGVFSGLFLGLVRIMEGGHFLSDILFAGIIIIVLNFIIYFFYKKYDE